jgi:hypothetical protein
MQIPSGFGYQGKPDDAGKRLSQSFPGVDTPY